MRPAARSWFAIATSLRTPLAHSVREPSMTMNTSDRAMATRALASHCASGFASLAPRRLRQAPRLANATLERVATYAAELDVPVHIHLHETEQEIRESLAAYRLRPIQRLQKLGLLGPGLIGVHAVHLTEDDMALLSQHGCHVAHCPSSNLKLASGIAATPQMLKQGINVGLGTDGAASNNRLDVFTEMRLAALIAKGATGDPTALPAHAVLEMATLICGAAPASTKAWKFCLRDCMLMVCS